MSQLEVGLLKVLRESSPGVLVASGDRTAYIHDGCLKPTWVDIVFEKICTARRRRKSLNEIYGGWKSMLSFVVGVVANLIA